MKIHRSSCTSNITVLWKADETAVGLNHRVFGVENSTASKKLLFEKVINEAILQETNVSLSPSTSYGIEIQACLTESECLCSAVTNVTTGGMPNAPLSAHIQNFENDCRVSWKDPVTMADSSKHYEIHVTYEVASSRNSTLKNTTVHMLKEGPLTISTPPNRNLTALLKSVSCGGESSLVQASSYCMTPSTAPDSVRPPSIQQNGISVEIPDERNGLISCLLVAVSNGSAITDGTDFLTHLFSGPNSWTKYHKEYIAVAVTPQIFAFRSHIELELGQNRNYTCDFYDTGSDGNNAGTFDNGTFLAQDKIFQNSTFYRVSVIAVVPSGTKILFKESEYANFTTDEFGMITKTTTTTTKDKTPTATDDIAIIAPVSALLTVGVLAAVSFLIIRVKRRRRDRGEKNPAPEAVSSTGSISNNREFSESAFQDGNKSRFRDTSQEQSNPTLGERTYENFADVAKDSTCFQVADIQKVYSSKLARNNAGFSEEFQKILVEAAKFQGSKNAASDESLKSKNRYKNILPYDATIVSLDGTESGYINASYVNGHGQEKRYIATQGPLHRTVNDFWLMVFEQKSQVIVMLTKTCEAGKKKCECYWPSSGMQQTYGSITVKNVEKIDYGAYIARKFRISSTSAGETGECMTLVQYMFLKWPDHGVPQTTSGLVRMHRAVLESYENSLPGGPIIVHCSAGAGRTGTFTGFDILFQQSKVKSKIDVHECVMEMRKQRVDMVQNTDQYVLLYKLVLESCLFDNTDCTPEELKEKISKVDSAEEMALLKTEFENLDNVPPMKTSQNVAKQEGNRKFNRNECDLPYDYSRVTILMQPDETSTPYINASWIETYDEECKMIAAQGVLSNTMQLFWRAIVTNNVTTIVMLTNSVEANEEQCVQYWPSEVGQKLVLDEMTITLVSDTAYASTVERKLLIECKSHAEPWVVTHIHFTDWACGSCPSEEQGIIELVSKMRENLRESHDRVALIHCSDGTGRTGTFCAIVNLLDRLRCENKIDVFRAVKDLRDRRPNMVKTLDQYLFCHRVIAYYLKTFEIYANF